MFLKSSPLQPFECVTTINIVTNGYPTMNAADLSNRTIFIPNLLIKLSTTTKQCEGKKNKLKMKVIALNGRFALKFTVISKRNMGLGFVSYQCSVLHMKDFAQSIIRGSVLKKRVGKGSRSTS